MSLLELEVWYGDSSMEEYRKYNGRQCTETVLVARLVYHKCISAGNMP
jgi:hypothetical protein